MKKRRLHLLMFCIAVVLCFSANALADVEWNTLNDVDLQETPLDIAVSRDGMTAFILCEKSIKLYSIREGKVTDTIPITASFSQIALSPDGQTMLLTDPKNKQLSVIRVTPVYDIKIGQSPVIGKADAPVSIFAFMDYQ